MFKLSSETIALIEDIEKRIDPDAEEDFKNQWKNFLDGNFEGAIFQPQRKKLSRSELDLKPININDAIVDYDLMLRSQLLGVSSALNSQAANLSIRANYGTGIMTSLFGAKIFNMPRSTNTLPTTHSFDDTEIIRDILSRGMPDTSTGFGKNVFDFAEICKEAFAKYPKISKYLAVYHPDYQGPLDVCELLWGGEMFYAMYDEPELVHDMLSLITETYTVMMNKWFEYFKPSDDIKPHWGNFWHKGNLVLRGDSAMNLSPEFYDEFSVPYDTILLERFGGGVMHFCGKGDHYIESLAAIPGINAINMSQPHYNDMEKIYQNTVDRGIMILGFIKDRALKDQNREGGFHHRLSI